MAMPFGTPRALILGGPGTGKSTEMIRIAEARCGQDFVVVLDLARHFDQVLGDARALQTIQSWEVVFLAGLAVVRTAIERIAPIPDEYIKGLAAAWTRVARATDTLPVHTEVDVSALSKAMIVTASAAQPGGTTSARGLEVLQSLGAGGWKLPVGQAQKKIVDQAAEMQSLLHAVNMVLGAVRKSVGNILLLVDGLDRITDFDLVEASFLESNPLAGLDCALVVSGSFALRRSPAASVVRGFDVVIPLLNEPVLNHQDPQRLGAGIDFFRELFSRRTAELGSDLVAQSELERLAYYSGGSPRAFVRFIQELAGQCWVDDVSQVTRKHVDALLDDARRNREVGLTRVHVRMLQGVMRDQRLPDDAEAWQLWRWGLILPYPNDSEWFYPHPLLTLHLLRSANGDRAKAMEAPSPAQPPIEPPVLSGQLDDARRLLRRNAPPLRLNRIEIRGFKNIAGLTLELDRPSRLPGRWTCFAGINGAGKSAVLQAITLVLLGDRLVAELGSTRLGGLCRRTGNETTRVEIRAWVNDDDTVRELYLPLGSSGIDVDALNAHPDADALRDFWRRREEEEIVVAYGPGRNLSDHLDDRHAALAPDVQAQMTLFDPLAQVAHANLLVQRGAPPVPALATLRKLLEQVLQGTPLAVAPEGPSFRFVLDGALVSPVELPDGFRATLAWLADLCAAWHRKAPEDARRGDLAALLAIVLVDEIDLHLHPSLQRTLIPNLRRALPGVQWIVTTHSPLILASFDRHELVLLEGRAGQVRELDRQVLGFSVDEIYQWLLDVPPRSAALDEAFRDASPPDAPEQRKEELAVVLAQSPKVDESEARENLAFRKALAKKLEAGGASKRAAPATTKARSRRRSRTDRRA